MPRGLCTPATHILYYIHFHRRQFCLSVTRVDQPKAVQARITKFLPSTVRKILVSGTVKFFHKFEVGHFERGAK